MKPQNSLIITWSIIYGACLLFDALDRLDGNFPATGFEILILGIVGTLMGLVNIIHGGAYYILIIAPWFANPLLFFCVYLTYKKKYKQATMIAGLASILTLVFLLYRKASLGPDGAYIDVELLTGYYLWATSGLLMFVGNILLLNREKGEEKGSE